MVKIVMLRHGESLWNLETNLPAGPILTIRLMIFEKLSKRRIFSKLKAYQKVVGWNKLDENNYF